MDNTDTSLRLAEAWGFCHARLNETSIALLAYREDRNPSAAETTPYRDAEFGLADIALKRTLLEEHAPNFPAVTTAVCPIDGDDCPFTQHLAAMYDTHPDYQESWRP
jgi:hypothetical protein